MSAIILKNKIKKYQKRKQLINDNENKKLEKPFLSKARKNYLVANILSKISEQEEVKKNLFLLPDFETYDWVIVVSYYSMYMAALAAIAKLGFKSKSHAATIAALEYYYVHQNKKLDKKQIEKLSKAYVLSETFISKLMQSKTRRETAQYEATPSITQATATTALEDAETFITRIEELLT